MGKAAQADLAARTCTPALTQTRPFIEREKTIHRIGPGHGATVPLDRCHKRRQREAPAPAGAKHLTVVLKARLWRGRAESTPLA